MYLKYIKMLPHQCPPQTAGLLPAPPPWRLAVRPPARSQQRRGAPASPGPAHAPSPLLPPPTPQLRFRCCPSAALGGTPGVPSSGTHQCLSGLRLPPLWACHGLIPGSLMPHSLPTVRGGTAAPHRAWLGALDTGVQEVWKSGS